MTHIQYWAMSFATAVLGAFLVINRFAFGTGTAASIALAVAIAATVFSLVGFATALVRENHAFSGLSAASAVVGAWTVIAMLVFSHPTGLWLAFASGLALLLLSLRALALHETTVERVVYSLQPSSETAPAGPAPVTVAGAIRNVSISPAMRSWGYWLAHTSLAIAGAFVVLMTYVLTAAGHSATPRDLALGIGIAATPVALAALGERIVALSAAHKDRDSGILGGVALSLCSAAVAIALIVAMILSHGDVARWVAFGLGCGLAGFSLLASALHELTSEHVRHELEVSSIQPKAVRETGTGLAA